MSPPEPSARRRLVVLSVVFTLLFLALGVVAFLIHLGMKHDPAKKPVDRPRTAVRVVRAERTDYREVLRGYGLARALRRVSVAAEVTGTVVWVSPRLEAGEVVPEGAELLRIDDRDYVHARDTAASRRLQAGLAVTRLGIDLDGIRKRLAFARADLEAARRELDRARDLTASGVATKSELDRERITTSLRERDVLQLESQEGSTGQELERATAEVAAAQATLEGAELDLARTTVRAPFAGRIERRSVDLGQRVAPGTALLDLVDPSRIEVPVALPASRFGEAAVGAGALLRRHDGGEPIWRGSVARVSPTVDERDRTFFVYLVVEVPGESAVQVPPGAFVLAEIEGALHPGVIPVPRSALVSRQVYLARPREGGLADIERATPEFRRLLPEVALVSKGVEPGDLVVVTNLEQVAEGSSVLLVDDEGATR